MQALMDGERRPLVHHLAARSERGTLEPPSGIRKDLESPWPASS